MNPMEEKLEELADIEAKLVRHHEMCTCEPDNPCHIRAALQAKEAKIAKGLQK